MRYRVIAIVTLAAAAVLPLMQGQAPPDGKAIFEKRCSGCHAPDRNKEGPALHGVFGRAAGSAPSFDYSEAVKKSGVTWNAETLDRWLTSTDQLIPGNEMNFRVDGAAERRALIEYLKKL